jgi:DNA-binding NtrC family response regulator
MGLEKEIVVLDADKAQCGELCALLKSRHYHATQVDSILNLQNHLQEATCQVVMLDLDTVPVDNRIIRDLTIKYPEVCFLGLCKQRYNPELKEAICYHIYACINKPVDPDEIFYWLRSICENEADYEKQNTE